MTLSDREKFIIANVVMSTSRWAKKFPRKVRESLLSFIRNKHAPSGTNDEWHEIAMDINEHIGQTKKSFLTGFYDAMKNPFKVEGDPELTKLDSNIRESMDEIDLENLDLEDVDPEVKKLLGQVRSLKKDYEDKSR